MKPQLLKVVVWVVLVIATVFAARAMVGTATAAQNTPGSGSSNPPPKQKKVSAGELQAKEMLLLMDKDQNGKVSRQEFMNFMEAEFNRLDVNKDGELDVKELTKSRLKVVEKGKASPRERNVTAGEAEARKLLRLMDKDQNGKISREEFMSFMEAEFNRLDVNKDGELDVNELAQSRIRTFTAAGK